MTGFLVLNSACVTSTTLPVPSLVKGGGLPGSIENSVLPYKDRGKAAYIGPSQTPFVGLHWIYCCSLIYKIPHPWPLSKSPCNKASIHKK